MPEFLFQATDSAGRSEQGTLSANDLSDAQRQLRARRLTPLSLKQGKAKTGGPKASTSQVSIDIDPELLDDLLANVARPKLRRRRSAKLGSEDVLRFTTELSVLLKAGIPLDRAIKVQLDSAPNDTLRDFFADLLSSLKGGKALSASLSHHEDLFGTLYINMIRSGEASGRLGEVLAELAEYLERSKAIRGAVVSALIYPAILAVVAAISVFIMLGFVVPEFEALFEDMGDALPILTQIIVWLGDGVSNWWFGMLCAGAVVWFWLRNWFRSPRGKQWLDLRAIKTPLIGQLLLAYETARFARTLGTLLHNGVALLKATDIAVGTVANSVIRSSLSTIAPAIKRGDRLSSVMDERIFPPVALQMVRVGEESGSLDAMLLDLAEVNENEVEATIKRLLVLLEPALILFMGGLIAVIIMGILMGILSVNTLVV